MVWCAIILKGYVMARQSRGEITLGRREDGLGGRLGQAR